MFNLFSSVFLRLACSIYIVYIGIYFRQFYLPKIFFQANRKLKTQFIVFISKFHKISLNTAMYKCIKLFAST